MAIKGKGKPKSRAGRVVTPGPRPAYVPPKVPLFQRTGAKFLFVLLIELTFFALLVGFGEQSQTDREKEALTEVSTLVDSALARGGAAIQLVPPSAIVLPELGTRVTEVQSGTAEEDAVLAETEAWSSSLVDASTAVAEIEIPNKNLEPSQVLALTEARNLIERGLLMYSSLSDQLGVAVQIEGDPRDQLIATIQTQIRTAVGTFDAGYGRLQEEKRKLGIALASPDAGGLPGGIPQTGGIPAGGVPPIEIPAEEPADDGGGGGGGGGGNGGNGNGGGGGQG
jgi:hypothetical protein